METWRSSTSQEDLIESIDIALLGKYTEAADSYISVIRALEHAAMTCRRTLKLHLIESSYLEELSRELQPEKYEQECHIVRTAKGILVPGGFGTRGTEGMIAAAKWARENKIPFLGVCLGANSIEFDENTAHPVVISMLEIDQEKLGGTMRLGMRLTLFQLGSEWTNIHRIYSSSGPTCLSSSHFASRLENEASTRFPKVATSNPKVPSLIIHERHRHRYEVNPAYTSALTSHGMDFVGKDDRGERMEILELREHPWFVGVQFHPEHLSRVLEPSQPYLGFLTASAGCFEEIVGKGKSKHA